MRKNICTSLIFFFILTGYLRAQDYLISFEGSGATSTVESVKVENITQSTEVTLSGSAVLRLKSVLTGIEQTADYNKNNVLFFPNPMNNNGRMRFFLPEPGDAQLTIFDLSGRKKCQKLDNLSRGEHIYRIEGVGNGIYFVKISTGKYSITGRLLSNGLQEGALKLTYENTISTEKKSIESKGSKAEVEMQYNTNDRLVFTASGGECIALVTDVASSDKTIKFDFQPCKDADGNKYPIVKIGTQTWMAANLKTTKYNNGDPIPLVTDNAAWAAIRYEAAYCWYNNDESTYKKYFGALYNFWAVSPGNLCPVGWHVPTYDEFATLETYLIQNRFNYDNSTSGNYIGKSLASTAMIFLNPPPSTASIMWEFTLDDGCVGNTDFPIKRNATGFSAMPSGFRGGDFSVMNRFAHWWSSTEYDMVMGRYRNLQSSWESLLGGYSYKWTGYSVRCLKNP